MIRAESGANRSPAAGGRFLVLGARSGALPIGDWFARRTAEHQGAVIATCWPRDWSRAAAVADSAPPPYRGGPRGHADARPLRVVRPRSDGTAVNLRSGASRIHG